MMTAALALVLLMQSGPNPATGAMPGIPDELRNRPPRAKSAVPAAATVTPEQRRLASCLAAAGSNPIDALSEAQRWRERADSNLELANTSHCLGLALSALGRFDEARTAFEMASDEAPLEEPAYRARLAGMAGNAALADNRADLALPLLAGAVEHAKPANDASLSAGLMIDEARALVALDRADEAAALLASARAAEPSNTLAWLLSATLSRRQNKLAEAQGEIEYAATLSPHDPAVGLEAGVIAALGGRDEAARASFEAVLAMDPDESIAAQARAYLEQLKP